MSNKKEEKEEEELRAGTAHRITQRITNASDTYIKTENKSRSNAVNK